jgi:hypothetical protein
MKTVSAILLLVLKLAAAEQQRGEFQPYNTVIGTGATTKSGIFIVHLLKEKLYFEIPPAELDKDFLCTARIARSAYGIPVAGIRIGDRVVRWHRQQNQILLQAVTSWGYADPKLAIARAVEALNYPATLMVFPIETFGADGAPVVEVSKFFINESPEFSARGILKAQGFDSARSSLARVGVFPTNIEVEATQTYTRPVDTPYTPPSPEGAPSAMGAGSATMLVHFSLLKLPEQPMRPRWHDDRVGFMSTLFIDFGGALTIQRCTA